MSPSLLTYRGAVYPWHCDHMGHMNVMWYVGKLTAEVAAVCTLTAIHLDSVARKAIALPPHVAESLAALGGGADRAPA